MDSTSMRTRLFVFYSLFSFICEVVGLNHNHFLLFSRIFVNLRKLRPKTMRLISNKSQIRDKFANYTPFHLFLGSPLSRNFRKYPSRKYLSRKCLSRFYRFRKYLTLLSSCPHQDRGLQLTGGVPTQRIE